MPTKSKSVNNGVNSLEAPADGTIGLILTDLYSASAALARIPRKQKRIWTGWLQGHHLRKNDLVILPDGRLGRVYGAVRGKVIVWRNPVPQDGWPADVYNASELRVYKNPHAVLLGKHKRGCKEVTSAAKRKSCQQNGSKPPRIGSRPRGRPRKGEVKGYA